MTAPFDLAETYRAKGWTGTVPLGVASKFPPPGGFTGYEGRWPTTDDITGWRSRGFRADGKHHDASNIALRLPAVAIGLDVDNYDDKAGADELVGLVEQWGQLPPTWKTTSRDDGSGILLFRVPSGVDPTTWPTGAGPSIEIIRHAHRYAVVWPSIHPETGLPYRWHRPDGSLADEGEMPGLGDLAELPTAWLVGLTGHGGNGGHVKPGSRASRRETDKRAREWITDLLAGEPCRYVGRLAADLIGAARREDGAAYDTTRDAVMALLRAGETGHPGVRDVLLAGRAAYAETVADKRGGRTIAEGEFDRFTLGGVAKILDEPSEKAGRGCDCGGPATTSDANYLTRGSNNSEPPDDPYADAPDDVEDIRDQRIAFEVDRLRVRHQAREIFDAERRGEMPPFDAGTLAEILARPAEPPHRIDGFLPSLGRLLVVAMRKTGKTTLLLNLALALLVGGRFLGRFTTRPITGRIAILNYELSAGMLAGWADQVGIPRDRLLLVNLRGRRNPLDHPDDRAHLIGLLRAGEVEVLLVDPFGRAYNGRSQNDAGEVTQWLNDLDRFASDGAVSELVLTVHAGWYAERTRGSSALEDWADVVATMVRDQEDDTARYLSAFGRDVEVDEDRLHYDQDTRALSLAGTGSRKHDQGERVIEAATETVRRYVADHPGCSGTAIRDGLGMRAGVVDRARHRLVDRGELLEEPRKGRGGGKGYRIPAPTGGQQTELPTEPRPTPSNPVPDEVWNEPNPVPSLIRDGVPSDHLQTEPSPTETEAAQ